MFPDDGLYEDGSVEVEFLDTDLEDEEYDVVLDFVDDQDVPEDYASVLGRVLRLNEQYGFDDILDMNEISDSDALALLYQGGFIGLPEVLEYDTDEDLPAEEAEDTDD